MVMGLEEAQRFADTHPDIEVYLIYADEQGGYQTYMSKGMEEFIKDWELWNH